MAAVYRTSLGLLGLLLALTAVLIHFQQECQTEREERRASKFNDHYQPDMTDCQAEIEFFKTESQKVSVTLGNSLNSQPLSVKYLIKVLSSHCCNGCPAL